MDFTTQSLTSPEDIRNQTKLIMQPYANWEEYLTPAPLSIAFLGELVFISSTRDIFININPPKDGYKHIECPESFRACLMQVCYSGWCVFNEALKSMDQIRLHTAQVPDYIKTAEKILFQDNEEVIQAHLYDQLYNIRVIADECLKLSTTTEERLMDVINIIQELLEACVNAEHFYREEMEVMKKKIQENELRQQSAQETKENELVQAHESNQKSMDSLPSRWQMRTLELVGGLKQRVTDLINRVPSITTVREASGASTKKNQIRGKEASSDVLDQIHAYSKSTEILYWVQKIQELMNVRDKGDDIDWTKLYDQRSKTTRSDSVAKQLERINDDLGKNSDSKVKSEAQALCLKGIDICKQLAIYAPEGKCDKDINMKIIEEVLELVKSACVFDSKSKDKIQSPAISSKPPMMFKKENRPENMSPTQRSTENARFTIEQNQAQLNKTREDYEYVEKNQKELTEILAIMSTCNLKEIDFKTIIEMLVKGMDALGRVKEQLGKMVYFFQMVSNIVKTLTNFVSTSEKTLSYNAKLFIKYLHYTQAFQACNIAILVHMISGTYTDVSRKYLMDCVSLLGRLITMDKSKPEFERERQMLQESCDAAQKGILSLVLKNKDEFDRKCIARQQQIDRELLAILTAAPPEETKRIQEAAQAGFSEEEEEASYY